MNKRVGQKRAQLYLREYPRLLRQICKLVGLVGEQDPNVALLALFGSTARLEPHPYSDSDLLILLHDPRVIYQGPRKTPGFSHGDRSGLAVVDKNVCSMVDSLHGPTI